MLARNQSERARLDAHARKLRDDLGLEIAGLFWELARYSADHGAAELANQIFERTLNDLARVISEYRKTEIG
jgi:hypothetical protein